MTTTFAELEAEIKRDNTREGIAASRSQGKWHGRPPFGFDVGLEDYLVPNDNYETAIVILDELDKGTSKRELGRRTGAGRSAVHHVANNRERYVGESIKLVYRYTIHIYQTSAYVDFRPSVPYKENLIPV